MRSAGVPAPAIVFYSADASTSSIGYEFICMEHVSYPPLADIWQSLPLNAMDNVLSQLVDIFISMFELNVPGGGGAVSGSLKVLDGGEIGLGPVLEETMWQMCVLLLYPVYCGTKTRRQTRHKSIPSVSGPVLNQPCWSFSNLACVHLRLPCLLHIPYLSSP